MRDQAKRYEGSTFTIEKVVAIIYAIMFVVIVGMGVQMQLTRIMPGEAEVTSVASVTASHW